MCLLKRVLPFVVTLTVGASLGLWANPRHHSEMHMQRETVRACRHYQARLSAASTWAIITSQPEVRYNSRAKADQVKGTLRLRVRLDADGTVSQVVPLTTLPDGLTEDAIDAARQIKFTPATENGRPVSVWVELDHEFTGDGVVSYCRRDVYDVNSEYHF